MFSFRVLPGDVNQDLVVNVLDWIEVRNRQGQTAADAEWSMLYDLDRRGSVDLKDFYIVPLNQYEQLPPWVTVTAARSAAVPEPSSIALVALALPAIIVSRRRRRERV